MGNEQSSNEYIEQNKQVDKYNYLFHKFILNISDPHKNIRYSIMQNEDTHLHHILVVHLHCYNSVDFNAIYGKYINSLKKRYFVIITYCKGDEHLTIKRCVVLKIKNQGMDIGAKFAAINYLIAKNIKYDFILFLHSKSNKRLRKIYFNPFLSNINNLESILDKNYGIYCPNIIHKYNKVHDKTNNIYMNQILDYMELPDYHGLFPEGNAYILSKDIAEYIFTDKLLYNSLNTSNSFDYSWVKRYYKLPSNDIQEIYNSFIDKKLRGNLLFKNKNNDTNLRDGMIEHVFERIVFGVCKKFKKQIYILDRYGNKATHLYNNNFLFDYQLYKDLYPDINNLDIYDAYSHFFIHGMKENRVCNGIMLRYFQDETKKRIQDEYDIMDFQKMSQTPEKLINILIRTSNRPEYFKNCIESILNQNYQNYRIYICYDKKESLDYLEPFKDYANIEYFFITVDSTEKYKFNLYLITLMECVKDGYIIFLDDDDKFCHDEVLNILNNTIDETSVMLWKFFRSNKLIYPSNAQKINLGEISGCAIISHKNNYKNCYWIDKQYGDFNFLNKVIENNKPNIQLLNLILSENQSKYKIGNFGK